MLQIWEGYATLCKDIIDARPQDTALLSQINEVWDQPLQDWNPEYADPQQAHLEFAIERGEPLDVVERIRTEVAENQRQTEVKNAIVKRARSAPVRSPVLDPSKRS